MRVGMGDEDGGRADDLVALGVVDGEIHGQLLGVFGVELTERDQGRERSGEE